MEEDPRYLARGFVENQHLTHVQLTKKRNRGCARAKARVNTYTMVWASVGYHEPSLRVCISILPEDESCPHLGASAYTQ
jgi:hypothetical protein